MFKLIFLLILIQGFLLFMADPSFDYEMLFYGNIQVLAILLVCNKLNKYIKF